MENKDRIEIPFGAKDSELCECEYTIPEGYEAEIKDGKVIIKKKESEDERIRKELIAAFQNGVTYNQISKARAKDYIAWLEKQDQTFTKKDIDDAYLKGVCDAKHELEKQGEQKHQYKSRPRYVGEEELLGKKESEWSEEDETTKNNISHIIRQYDKISKRENQPCYYVGDCLLWMQNIKDRVQPQPKQEWSEEDKIEFDSIIYAVERNYELANKQKNWLKSLRPQNRWKPSDAQMVVLNDIIINGHLSNANETILKGLQEQLKKLKD